MNSNPSVSDYFGLKSASTAESPVKLEKEFAFDFYYAAMLKLCPYDKRIEQLGAERDALVKELTKLTATKPKGFLSAITTALKQWRLESRIKKIRDLNIIVHDERLRTYSTDYAQFKNESTRLYGTQFEDSK